DASKAAGSFARALALGPNDREILLRLSNLFMREQDYANALKATRRLVDLETAPGAKLDLLVRLAEIYSRGLGETRQASEALRRACDLDPRNLRPVEALAQLFAGDVGSRRVYLDRSLAATRALIERNIIDLDAWRTLMRIFEWRDAPEQAHAAALVV